MKNIIIFVFVFVLVSNIYGHEKNAVSVSIGNNNGPEFMYPSIGVGYERQIKPSFSFLLSGNFALKYEDGAPSSELIYDLDIIGHIRLYFLSKTLNGFFFDIGTGVTLFYINRGYTIMDVLFPLQSMIGCKFILKKIYIEPYIGNCISFGNIKNPKYSHPEYHYKILDTKDLFKSSMLFLGISFGFVF